jgi:hypothetical protein
VCQGFQEWSLWQHHLSKLGGFNVSVQCVHSKKKIPIWIVGASGILRNKGYWEV